MKTASPANRCLDALRAAAGALALGLLGGCAVPQRERELLADPIMRFDADPEGRHMENHLLPYREGSSGGNGEAGGGCGC